MTSNGRFVVFEYAGDPLGSNSDGNIEIFRFDRNSDTLIQVTDTSGCSNTHPGVSNDGQGRRIGFLSDCTELEPGDGFNPDGNREVVLYDNNSGNFQFNGTSSCDNNSVVISTDNSGRYLTYVSTCNYTGGNGDGNAEIFQWDRRNDSYRQITSSTLASGAINDVPSSTDSGDYVAFVSNANYGGQNAAGNMVVYRWTRSGNSISRITPSSASYIYSYVSIDDSGNELAYERFNLNTFELQVLHRTISSGVETVIASENAQLPVIGVNGGTPNVTFLSNANYNGNNGDLNQEIWRGEP
jgi:6-phosphogluconolactonase (cycloisomerase 2 family)